MVLILRVEKIQEVDGNLVNKGIYSEAGSICMGLEVSATRVAYDLDRRHPTPSMDSGMKYTWNRLSTPEMSAYRFGFADYAQYRNWFWADEFLKIAAQREYKLAAYEVDSAHKIQGHTQVAFQIDKAQKVYEFELLDSKEKINSVLDTYQKSV